MSNRLLAGALIISWILFTGVVLMLIAPKAAGVVAEEQATKVRCYAKKDMGSDIVKEVEFNCALLVQK